MSRYRFTATNSSRTPRKNTLIYPYIPEHSEDTYVITTSGDRFDILASQYYNDSTMWWIIASANPEVDRSSLQITPGIQIRIPFNKSRILDLVQSTNNNR